MEMEMESREGVKNVMDVWNGLHNFVYGTLLKPPTFSTQLLLSDHLQID